MNTSPSCSCGLPALFQCQCQASALPFCQNCLSLHTFTTAGHHHQCSLQSSPCQLCRTQPATCICSCRRLPLCVSCYSAHKDHDQHLCLPMLEGRGADKALGLAEVLLEGLEEARMSQQTAIEALNQFMRMVHTYKLQLLSRLTEEIKVLERVVQGAIGVTVLPVSCCQPAGA